MCATRPEDATDYLVGLGNRVRSIRKQRGLTQDEVAEKSGLSKSMLSAIERGQTNCTIGVLVAIATALGVPIHQLFESEPEVPRPVIRRSERKVAVAAEGERRAYLYDITRNVEVSENLYRPGAISSSVPLSHSGWECGIVLEGTLDVQVDGETYRLEAGDCFAFESARPHRFVNPSPQWTRLAWFNLYDPGYPPLAAEFSNAKPSARPNQNTTR